MVMVHTLTALTRKKFCLHLQVCVDSCKRACLLSFMAVCVFLIKSRQCFPSETDLSFVSSANSVLPIKPFAVHLLKIYMYTFSAAETMR